MELLYTFGKYIKTNSMLISRQKDYLTELRQVCGVYPLSKIP